jgi:hypothetical protein
MIEIGDIRKKDNNRGRNKRKAGRRKRGKGGGKERLKVEKNEGEKKRENEEREGRWNLITNSGRDRHKTVMCATLTYTICKKCQGGLKLGIGW